MKIRLDAPRILKLFDLIVVPGWYLVISRESDTFEIVEETSKDTVALIYRDFKKEKTL